MGTTSGGYPAGTGTVESWSILDVESTLSMPTESQSNLKSVQEAIEYHSVFCHLLTEKGECPHIHSLKKWPGQTVAFEIVRKSKEKIRIYGSLGITFLPRGA
jgi:hypothetical protein